MATTRDELLTYVQRVFSVTPKQQPSVAAFTALVHRHRRGEDVQRELLAAMVVKLGDLASRYQRPGDLVSEFWEALTSYDTPLHVMDALRVKVKDGKRSDARRTKREEDYQREELGLEASLDEGLPSWFWELPEDKQRILWGVLLEEEDKEVAAETGVNEETAKKRRQRLFDRLQKKFGGAVPPGGVGGPAQK